jgi:hypothetical protein
MNPLAKLGLVLILIASCRTFWDCTDIACRHPSSGDPKSPSAVAGPSVSPAVRSWD